jgi:hypothetical protein
MGVGRQLEFMGDSAFSEANISPEGWVSRTSVINKSFLDRYFNDRWSSNQRQCTSIFYKALSEFWKGEADYILEGLVLVVPHRPLDAFY